MLLRFLGLALIAGSLVGCGLGDGGNPPTDGPLYVLAAEPTSALGLVFGESGEVAVVARDLAGEKVEGLEITFLLEGTSKDSGLSNVTAITNGDGVATTTVTAGWSNALFRVRASAERAEPVFRSVAVSTGGFGSLDVTGGYAGDRALDSFALTLYIEAGCKDTRVVEGEPGDRLLELAQGADEGTFELLPATSTYAVVVDARYASGTTFARGCVDGVTVTADASTPLTVDAIDLPYVAEGDYDAKLALDLASVAAELAGAAQSGGAEAILASGGDASFLLDAVAAALTSPASFAAMRPDLDVALEAELDAGAVGPTKAVELAAEALLAELGPVGLSGLVSIAPRGGPGERLSFEADRLEFGASAGEAIAVELSAAGIAVNTSRVSTFDALDGSATIDFLLFDLSSSELARAALRAAAIRAGASSLAEWLAGPAGCDALDANAAVVAAAEASGCDAACVRSACEGAAVELAEAMEQGIAESAGYGGVGAAGTMTLTDLDEDLVIDALDATLTCQLVNGTTNPVVPGSLEATRAGLTALP